MEKSSNKEAKTFVDDLQQQYTNTLDKKLEEEYAKTGEWLKAWALEKLWEDLFYQKLNQLKNALTASDLPTLSDKDLSLLLDDIIAKMEDRHDQSQGIFQFLWIKCISKTTMAKIAQRYGATLDEQEDALTLSYEKIHKGFIWEKTAQISNMPCSHVYRVFQSILVDQWRKNAKNRKTLIYDPVREGIDRGGETCVPIAVDDGAKKSDLFGELNEAEIKKELLYLVENCPEKPEMKEQMVLIIEYGDMGFDIKEMASKMNIKKSKVYSIRAKLRAYVHQYVAAQK